MKSIHYLNTTSWRRSGEGEGSAPRILNFGTMWRWEVKFTPPAALPPKGNRFLYSLDKRLRGPQNRSGCGGKEEKIPCPCRESNTGGPARSLVTILSELHRFYLGKGEKGKVVPVLNYHAMKTYGGAEVKFHVF